MNKDVIPVVSLTKCFYPHIFMTFGVGTNYTYPVRYTRYVKVGPLLFRFGSYTINEDDYQ